MCAVAWGCAVPWGVLRNVGDILSAVGVTWGIFSTVGDIMMHVGGYHEYRGDVQYHGGKNLLLFEYRHGTEHPPQYS